MTSTTDSGHLAPVTALPFTTPADAVGPALGPPPVDVGDGRLTAAYCAERAASALHRAEVHGPGYNDVLLKTADRWSQLAIAMSQNVGLTRPAKPDNDTTRR